MAVIKGKSGGGKAGRDGKAGGLAAIVLAAGKGTRMRSERAKSSDQWRSTKNVVMIVKNKVKTPPSVAPVACSPAYLRPS